MSHALVPRPAAPLIRSTTECVRWSRDAALIGALTGYLGPALAIFGFSLHPWLLACSATGALFGAILGWLAPIGVEWMRPRASLYAIVALMPLLGFVLGAPLAALAALVVGAPVTPAAIFGAFASGVQIAMFSLPYLVQAVLGRSRWPILLAATAMATILGMGAEAIVLGGWLWGLTLAWGAGFVVLIGMVFGLSRPHPPRSASA